NLAFRLKLAAGVAGQRVQVELDTGAGRDGHHDVARGGLHRDLARRDGAELDVPAHRLAVDAGRGVLDAHVAGHGLQPGRAGRVEPHVARGGGHVALIGDPLTPDVAPRGPG